MHMLASDWLFTGVELLPRRTLVLSETGVVESILEGISEGAAYHEGLLSPAFVNAHCHLELSHLRGKIQRHTGMAGFVRALQPIRDKFTEDEKAEAIEAALLEMHQGGIAGIGDICNGSTTLSPKQDHPEFLYHNFIELFGLNPNAAEEIFFRGLDLLREFGRHTSVTLHAPYSMSIALRDKLLGYAQRREWPVSIHLLESKEERQLFEDLEGPLLDFIRDIGAVFQAHTYPSVIDFVTESLPHNCNVLLVHNTEMTPEELATIADGWPRTWFALCPLANQYIHGSLPDARMFATYPDRVCLGTDSLAGNDRLSILAEMQALQAAFGIESEMLLRWGTLNGASALGLDPSRFRVAVGSHPILINIADFKGDSPRISQDSKPQFIKTC